jgi:hypothetical protein
VNHFFQSHLLLFSRREQSSRRNAVETWQVIAPVTCSYLFLSLRAAHDVLIQLESTPMKLQVGQVCHRWRNENESATIGTFRPFQNENAQQLTTLCEESNANLGQRL